MVEVRQGAGGEETRRGEEKRGEEEEEEDEKREEKEEDEDEEEATDIKSNNPHLAGGEKHFSARFSFVIGVSIFGKPLLQFEFQPTQKILWFCCCSTSVCLKILHPQIQ